MGKGTKLLIAGALVLAAVGAAWIYMWRTDSSVSDTQPVENAIEGGASAPRQGAPALGSAQGNTDASLEADLSAIDAQMKAVESDAASADGGLNDKPIEQTE